MKKHIRIAIIGGGPGGLTLARVLYNQGISATVFELDEHPLSRPQGGTLDLHPESGQLALRQAGLEAEFKRIARYDDQETRLYDQTGKLRLENADASSGDRPEVDRSALRQILLDSLPEGVIRWGHKLRLVQPQEDGTYTVAFENGESDVFDLVVGADGAWSRVRPLVSDAIPAYCGVSFVELGLDDVDTDHPEIACLVGHGTMFALGDSKALIAQRNANAHIRVYAALRVPEDWFAQGGVDLTSPESARRSLTTYFSDWAPELLRLIANSNDRIVPRLLYALPIGHRWENRPGVTLLGDAAHLMSPFSGQGVNNAMLDAAELTFALSHALEKGGDWIEAVRLYEVVMLDRAEEASAASAQGLDSAIAPDGLAHTLEWMQGILEPQEADSSN